MVASSFRMSTTNSSHLIPAPSSVANAGIARHQRILAVQHRGQADRGFSRTETRNSLPGPTSYSLAVHPQQFPLRRKEDTSDFGPATSGAHMRGLVERQIFGKRVGAMAVSCLRGGRAAEFPACRTGLQVASRPLCSPASTSHVPITDHFANMIVAVQASVSINDVDGAFGSSPAYQNVVIR